MKLVLHPSVFSLQLLAMYSLLSFLLLSGFGLAAGLNQQPGCPTSSCGELQCISYPFCLKGDPAGCGRHHLEVVCDNNKTILDLNSSGKYYVTNISNSDHTFHVVDTSLASGSCILPLHSLSYSTLAKNGWHALIWASFVNCTRMIKNDMYRPVPCLRGYNTFVYVIVSTDAYELGILEPSCGYLAMFPIPDAPLTNSDLEVIKLFQKGFTISFDPWHGSSWIFRHCLREARWVFQDPFPSNQILSNLAYFLLEFLVGGERSFICCMNEYYAYRTFIFWIALVMIILTMIVKFSIVCALLVRCVGAPLTVYVFLAYKFWSTQVSIDTVEKFLRNQQNLTPTRYAYTDIIAITNHFNVKLGQGGFGSVFKGKLAGGHLVAVKMLGNSKCNGEEFINEVSTIGRIHHVNIVQLVGFCSEGSKRALVYECMPNGSLDKYIFSSNATGQRAFTWDKLNDIALGVARGINYLHQGCDMQILHFDIKPHNILLDQNFNPKISDFGLAKLYPKDYSVVSISAARGTIGYIAPELISRNFGVVSYRSDVYSFGMLLLEMCGGRRNADPRVENSSQIYYPSWIYDRLTEREALEICDATDIGEVESKLSKVGLCCIQMKSSNRPSMGEVIEMLEEDVDSLQMPPRPFFSSPRPTSVEQSCMDSLSTGLSIISEHD